MVGLHHQSYGRYFLGEYKFYNGMDKEQREAAIIYAVDKEFEAQGKAFIKHPDMPRIIIGRAPVGPKGLHPIITKCQWCAIGRTVRNWKQDAEVWVYGSLGDVYTGWVGYCAFDLAHAQKYIFEADGYDSKLTGLIQDAFARAGLEEPTSIVKWRETMS